MWIDRRIGPEPNLHAAGEGMRDVLARGRHDFLAFGEHRWGDVHFGRVFQEPVTEIQSWNEVRAMRLHGRDSGVIDVGTMLDGVDSRFRGPENALRAVSMRSDLAAQTMGVSDDRAQFLLCELRCLGIVAQ